MNVKRLLIIGAGYTGLELARQALAIGLEVAGTSRCAATHEKLEALGATAIGWDVLTDPLERLSSWVGPATAIVYSVPPLFDAYEQGSGEALPRHVAPVARLLEFCVRNKAARFIYLSSTSVYGDHLGRWVDEDSPLNPDSPAGLMRRDIEEYVLSRGEAIDANVGRIVGIYGPGRSMDRYIASGRYRLVDGGSKPTNRIHVEDLAKSLLAMIDKGPSGARLYNLCDGNPIPVRDLVEYVCQKTGISMPPDESLEAYAERTQNADAVGRWKNAIRCKNTRLTSELGVKLRYPDAFLGLEALLKEHRVLEEFSPSWRGTSRDPG